MARTRALVAPPSPCRALSSISCDFQKTYGSCAARLGVFWFCRSPFDGWSLSGGHLEPQAWGFEWRVPRIHPSVARWPPVPSLELITMRSCRPFAVFRRTALRCAVALSLYFHNCKICQQSTFGYVRLFSMYVYLLAGWEIRKRYVRKSHTAPSSIAVQSSRFRALTPRVGPVGA